MDHSTSSKHDLWTTVGKNLERHAQSPPLVRSAEGTPAPLSFAQEQLWLIHQSDPASAAYNVAHAWRLSGELNTSALEKSLSALMQRHESLRTKFAASTNGPVQIVSSVDHFQLTIVKMAPAANGEEEANAIDWLKQACRRPFDLAKPPLLRAYLLRFAPARHYLLLVIHHIACDGASLGVLYRELQAFYSHYALGETVSLPELPVQYADYALWQRQWLQEEVLETQLAYWKKKLSGPLPILELPTDYPRPLRLSARGGVYRFNLPPQTCDPLKNLRQHENTTVFSILMAAFQALLFRYTGQEDFLVGFPTGNRTRKEIRALIGYFVNTQILRSQPNGDLSFRQFVQRVGSASLEALAHQDVPFEKLIQALNPARDLSYTAAFQVMFSFQSLPRRGLELPGLQVEEIHVDTGCAMFDLTLDVNQTQTGLPAFFEYRLDLFEPSTIQRLAGHFQTLLAGAMANPDQPLWQLPLLTPAEHHQVTVEWNATAADFPVENSYTSLFQEQVRRNPSAPALRYLEEQWTYARLNRAANQLAHYLQGLGVGPEKLVAVFLERSPEFAISALAAWKAGGAYLPMDPGNPAHHHRQILDDAHPVVVLTNSKLVRRLPPFPAKIVCVDDPQWKNGMAEFNPVCSARADSLAYVIYTSGSTGQPKGVQITHRSLLNHNFAMAKEFNLNSADRVLQFSSLTFDLSIEEIFPAWLTGACVILRTPRMLDSMQSFMDFVAKERISILDLPTAFWHELIEFLPTRKLPACVRLVVIGGEKASPQKFAAWKQYASSVQLINTYGPTETTVSATLFCAQQDDRTDLPIGRPIANITAYVLDPHQQPVPIGVPGELYIGGAGVARGYLNRPELTAERFLPNPFTAQPNARFYRTGDRVRWLRDGTLEFLGRVDQQVKIRGFRIEPGEIESVLLQHPQIRQAVVVASTSPQGETRLVAYFVAKKGAPTSAELRQFLREQMPAYMVPAFFVALDQLPLTSSGKVDRHALPMPQVQPEATDQVPPRTAIEVTLAEIWRKVLGLKQVGIYDNFFDLGGHSLKAVWLFQEIKTAFQKNFPMVTLFEAPTIAQLAEVIARQLPSATWSSLVAIKPGGRRPPFYCVHGVGGNILEFLDLAKYMDPEQPFYGLQAVGLDGKRPWLETVQEMAAHYIAEIKAFQPQGPYYLGGASFGGIVAYEIAQQLRAQGDELGLLAFFDTGAPGYPKLLPKTSRLKKKLLYWQYRVQLHWSNLRACQGKERWIYVRTKILKWLRGKWTRANEFYHYCRRRFEERLLPREIRKTKDFGNRAVLAYTAAPYPGRVTLFRAMERPKGIYPDPLLGWGELVKGGVEIYDTPGHHGAIMRDPRARVLAEQLKDALRKAQQTCSAPAAKASAAKQPQEIPQVQPHAKFLETCLR